MHATPICIAAHLREHLELVRAISQDQIDEIARLGDALRTVLEGGGTIYLCGNGGSAADAQHVAAELIGRYLRDRAPLPAVALTTDTSVLTALANDYDFAEVFARQVRALVTKRDAVVGISTSGKSPNVLAALRAARRRGALTVAFTGVTGEPLASEADVCFRAPSARTPLIQEAHILVWHILCELIEDDCQPVG